jgi:hypothetical protein
MRNRLIIIAYIILITATSYSSDRYFSDDVLISRVLKARDNADTIPPQNITEREHINFIFDIGAKLLTIIENNPGNNEAWKALHHFRSLTDAGLTSSFEMDCFDILRKNPLLFYYRYMQGDNLGLERMDDAISGYLIDDYGDIHIREKENRKLIDSIIAQVKLKTYSNSEQRKRHTIFIKALETKYEWRKKVFKEYFGDLKN